MGNNNTEWAYNTELMVTGAFERNENWREVMYTEYCCIDNSTGF